jgi:hypothetical protein
MEGKLWTKGKQNRRRRWALLRSHAAGPCTLHKHRVTKHLLHVGALLHQSRLAVTRHGCCHQLLAFMLGG